MELSATTLLPSRPYSNVQPFTVRDGATMLMQMESIKTWLRDYLVPHVNSEVGSLSTAWLDQTERLINNWADLAAELEDRVNTAASGAADASTVANAAKVAAEAAAQLAEQFASDAQNVQDVSVTQILSDGESLLRQAAESIFVTASDFAAVGDALAGRLSEATLGDRFDEKADVTLVTPLKSELEGRLSPATLDARFDALIDDEAPSDESAYSSIATRQLVSSRMIVGEVSTLPAPTTVEDGVQFVSTDVPELYVNNGDSWLVAGAGGNEVGYAEVVPMFSHGGTEPVDVPGMSSTFKVGKRPVEIQVTARLAISVTTSVAYLRFLLDGEEIGVLNYVAGYADQWETHTWARVIHGLPEGSMHTVKVQIARAAVGTGLARIGGDPTNPNVLIVSTK